MKNRTTTSRNLLGGFCGGVLGIFSGALFTPEWLWLALGCLIGVSAGYWYGEVWSILYEAGSTAWVKISTVIERSSQRPKLKYFGVFAHLSTWLKRKVQSMRRAYVFLRTGGPKIWVTSNPAKVIRSMSLYATLTVALIAICYAYFAIFKVRHESSDTTLLIKGAMTAWFLFVTMLSSFVNRDMNKEVFKKNYRAIRKNGIIRFFLFKTSSFIIEGVFLIPIFSVAIFLGLILGFFGWIWFGVVYGFLKTLRFVFTKTNHIPCYTVTLLTTLASAYVFQPVIQEPVRLWLVALSTGIVAGLLTEGCRRLYLWCAERIPFLVHAANQKTEEYSTAMWGKLEAVVDIIMKPVGKATDSLLLR